MKSDGRTDDIKANSGPPCLQEALAAWVGSFRYEAPGQEIAWGELSVGARSIFDAAGFRQVSHPVPRRVVMQVEFGQAQE